VEVVTQISDIIGLLERIERTLDAIERRLAKLQGPDGVEIVILRKAPQKPKPAS
jgi:hypothetical protein